MEPAGSKRPAVRGVDPCKCHELLPHSLCRWVYDGDKPERADEEQGEQAVKIEEGKYYRTRDGKVRGPMFCTHVHGRLQFSDGHWTYYESGTWAGENCPEMDLVSEAPPPNVLQSGDSIEGAGITPNTGEMFTPDLTEDYAPLRAILDAAYEQAASGKGKERHANDRPFLDQPICEIGRMLASVCDGELYQAIKKAQEASNMLARGDSDKAEHELLGAINYLAAAVILIREEKA